MSHAKLLVEELLPNECNLITESSNDGKSLWLNGIMMQADIKNRNGRNYPLHEISSAVNDARIRITEGNGIMGELDHPTSLSINLDRVSHVITELWMQGQNACGKAKIIEGTPMGNIAKALIDNKVRLGVSSRGAGNVHESTGAVSGFQFITVDIVAQPSAQNAYPGSVYESLQMSSNSNKILTLAEHVHNDVDAQRYFKQEILKWLATDIFQKSK
jgi:hypothetical protein